MRPSGVSCRGVGRPPVPGRGPLFMTTSGNLTPLRPEKKDIGCCFGRVSVYIVRRGLR